jgi:hypothetical protein
MEMMKAVANGQQEIKAMVIQLQQDRDFFSIRSLKRNRADVDADDA